MMMTNPVGRNVYQIVGDPAVPHLYVDIANVDIYSFGLCSRHVTSHCCIITVISTIYRSFAYETYASRADIGVQNMHLSSCACNILLSSWLEECTGVVDGQPLYDGTRHDGTPCLLVGPCDGTCVFTYNGDFNKYVNV